MNIIYGRGKLFQRYMQLINWDVVVAIADKNAGLKEKILGKPVILPQNIIGIKYDYIVVFSDKLFDEIRKELMGEYYIEPEKIISWRFLIKREEEAEAFFSLKRFIKALNIKSVLDTDMSIIPQYVFSKKEINSDEEFVLDGVGEKTFMSYGQIYGKIYDKVDDVCNCYELIYIDNVLAFDHNILSVFQKNKYQYILLRMPYDGYAVKNVRKIYLTLQEYGEVKKFYLADSIYWLLSADQTDYTEIDVQIYVVMHRNYNVLNNRLYRPICVGTKFQNKEYLSEQKGDNISYLNNKINECTALYWVWKNTSCEYIGINHYRRYFYNNEILSESNYLDKGAVRHIFQKYDIILPEYRRFDHLSVKEQLRSTISIDAFEQGYRTVRSTMAIYQPDYLDAFDTVMNGHKLFICNMFVMRRSTFNEYCEWLFSFLIEAAERIDVHTYDDYSKRVIGFFAERMLTVWIIKQNLKIKELPIDSWK